MADKANELRKKAASNIKDKCSDKVLKLANIATTGALGLGSFMRLLYSFGVGSGAAAAVVVVAPVAPATPDEPATPDAPDGNRRLAEASGGGFSLFLMINSLYLMSFIAIYGLVLVKEAHPMSIKARVYFNFLNSLSGKGFALIFLGLITLEVSTWYDWIIGMTSIVVGVCNLTVGWDHAPVALPESEFNIGVGAEGA